VSPNVRGVTNLSGLKLLEVEIDAALLLEAAHNYSIVTYFEFWIGSPVLSVSLSL